MDDDAYHWLRELPLLAAWIRERRGRLPLIVPPGPTIAVERTPAGVRLRQVFEPYQTGGTRVPRRPFHMKRYT